MGQISFETETPHGIELTRSTLLQPAWLLPPLGAGPRGTAGIVQVVLETFRAALGLLPLAPTPRPRDSVQALTRDSVLRSWRKFLGCREHPCSRSSLVRPTCKVGDLNELDKSSAWIREAVVAGKKYSIKRKSPLLHNLLNLTLASTLLLIMCLVALASQRVSSWHYLLWAPWVFGWAYFTLFILVVHEASHGMFVTLQNSRWAAGLNRVAGTVVAVFFATDYKKHWEVGHLAHHVRPLEPTDPQRHNALVGRALLLRVVACLFVPGFLFFERTLLRTRQSGGASSSSRGTLVAFAACWSVLLFFVTTFVSAEAALAMFLGIHVIVALNHIKGSLEHGGELRNNQNPFLRSRTTFFAGRWLLMPLNITLHFEHHLNYRVPWYSLPGYHRELMSIVPSEYSRAIWNHHPLSQLAGRLGPIPSLDPVPS